MSVSFKLMMSISKHKHKNVYVFLKIDIGGFVLFFNQGIQIVHGEIPGKI